MKTRDLTQTALLSAAICVLAPWVIPMGAIPLTLGSFAVSLVAGVGGAKKGTAATLIYILLGGVGLPVFSGFSGGAQMLLGITGGFIVGYIPLCICVGIFCDKFRGYFPCLGGQLLGTALLYLIGTAWYSYSAGVGFVQSLSVCVLPFVLTDFLKISLAAAVIVRLRGSINKLIR